MTRAPFFVGLVFVLAALVTGIATQASFDAEKQSGYPRSARPAAGVQMASPPYVDWDAVGEQQKTDDYLRGERERIERELVTQAEAEARAVAVRPVVPRPTTTAQGCDGHVVPGWILQRESGCDYGAVNPTGCSGFSCVGLYQFDLRHFTSGQCSGLDWHIPADQDECARRLIAQSGLAPWGG